MTPIAAEGNEPHRPRQADVRRHLPGLSGRPDAAARRARSTTACQSMPTEARRRHRRHPRSGRRRARPTTPNYGVEQADVSAPGGDTHDTPDGSAQHRERGPRRLPEGGRCLDGRDDRPGDGRPKSPARVIRAKERARYYQYLQGTSMASPHAVGVAALIVAQYGQRDKRNGGLTMRPGQGRADPAGHGHRPRPARRQEPFTYAWTPAPAPELHRDLRGLAEVQRVLRRRHRRRARGRPPLADVTDAAARRPRRAAVV